MDRAEILALGWAKNLDEIKYKHNPPNKVSYAIKPHKAAHLAMLYKVKLNGFQKILQISKFLRKPKLTVCLVQKYYTQQSSYSFFSSHPLLFSVFIHNKELSSKTCIRTIPTGVWSKERSLFQRIVLSAEYGIWIWVWITVSWLVLSQIILHQHWKIGEF